MSVVVFSIKPKFVELIFMGCKKFEYRKRKFRQTNISKIIIYATSPICKVVGEVRIKNVLVDTPDAIWDKTAKDAGVDSSFYKEYFANRDFAVAYELCDVVRYEKQKTIHEIGLTCAPQSFAYINDIVTGGE